MKKLQWSWLGCWDSHLFVELRELIQGLNNTRWRKCSHRQSGILNLEVCRQRTRVWASHMDPRHVRPNSVILGLLHLVDEVGQIVKGLVDTQVFLHILSAVGVFIFSHWLWLTEESMLHRKNYASIPLGQSQRISRARVAYTCDVYDTCPLSANIENRRSMWGIKVFIIHDHSLLPSSRGCCVMI